MKCNACSEEVSSKFAHAIATNACPFCGDPIMEQNLQVVLNSLREVMTEANQLNYLPAAFDWLKSNCNLISMDAPDYKELIEENAQLKTELETLKSRGGKGSAELKKNMPSPEIKVDDEGNEYQVNGLQIQDEDTTSGFIQRAGVKKLPSNQDHFKNIVNKLKKVDAGGGGPGPNSFSEMMNMPLDQLEKYEMQSMGMPGPSSAIDMDYVDSGIDPVMENLLQGVHIPGQGKDMQGWNAKDALTLQKMNERVSENQSGGREFKFKR